MRNKPNISRTAFWDVDFESIDFEAKSVSVIGKVLNYGSWNDVLELFRFYGPERIKKEIVEVPYLDKKVINFWSGYFKINEKEFKCYKRKQLATIPWIY